MPLQISKCIGVMLLDEEVEAWQTLEAYLLKKKVIDLSQLGTKKVGARRMIRELLRLAAEHVAAEIGPKVAEKLSAPAPMPPRKYRNFAQSKAKPVAKARGRKPAKKPDPKPTHRIAWDRPWGSRAGDA